MTYEDQEYGQLLQAAICDSPCIDRFGRNHVGCTRCVKGETEEEVLAWDYCLDCSFDHRDVVHECTLCADGWTFAEDRQGCVRIPIPDCVDPSFDNLECLKCRDGFSWTGYECALCIVDKCLQCD